MLYYCKGCYKKAVFCATEDAGIDWTFWCYDCHDAIKRKMRFIHGVGGQSEVFGMTCEFHIGFLCILETEEQLSRLRKPEPVHVPKKRVMSDSTIPLTPINKTAGVVTGITEQP